MNNKSKSKKYHVYSKNMHIIQNKYLIKLIYYYFLMGNSVCFHRVVTLEDALISSHITQQKEKRVGPLILALLRTLAAEKITSQHESFIGSGLSAINNVCVHPQPKCFGSFSRRFILLLNWPLVCVCVCEIICIHVLCPSSRVRRC